uniref:Membrane protein, putative n=2 Tax=Babesia bovis TaxID=5865 RepID=A7AMW6_BABBO|eukprot:XP_001611468.1 membrane protein [Babesia bovis T2Bo]
MTVCDISVVLGAGLLSCPSECPYWSQSAVWKGVGVCTTKDRCSVYNPLLSYADERTKVCLPCSVYGCSSCTYSNSVAFTDSDSLVLPDICLRCAPGYRMQDGGNGCYLVESSLWSRSFYAIVAAVLVCLLGLALRMALRPSQLEANIRRYRDALKSQKIGNWSDSLASGFFRSLIDLCSVDVSGVGVILYFRFLVFMGGIIFFMLVMTIAHAHIPCSDMIRSFSAPFSLDKPGEMLEARSWLDLFKPKGYLGLKDHLRNFKYVDDAIEWSVGQYADDTARVMRVLYLCVMGSTIVFAIYQRDFLKEYFREHVRTQYFTLMLDRVPPLHSLEEFVHGATGVRPKSVAVVYDLGDLPEGMDKLLDGLEEEGGSGGVYVNLDMSDQHRLLLRDLQPSGSAFAVFNSRQDMHRAMKTLEHNGICDSRICEIEPEDVMWFNLHGPELQFGHSLGVTFCICLAQLLWTFVFFLPYAAYKLHSDSTDFFECLWLSWFASIGNSLVGTAIQVGTSRISFVNREHSESYLMWISAFMQLINVGCNLLLAHLVNYGGRYKVVSMVKDYLLYMRTPTFRVGEEVSISQSLNSFMKGVLLSIPLMTFLCIYYAMPILKLLFLLSADLGETETSRLVRGSKFTLPDRYCTSIVYLTSCLLLQFVIESKLQAVTLSLCLLASCILHYVTDGYLLFYKCRSTRISGFGSFYNALLLWSLPTGLLAICPSYWRWRAANGRLSTIIIIFCAHMLFYHCFMRHAYGKRWRFDVSEHNTSNSDYTMGNPVYTLRRLVPS